MRPPRGTGCGGFALLAFRTRANAMRSTTSATDFAPLSQLQLMRFKGESWDRFGDIISSDVGG